MEKLRAWSVGAASSLLQTSLIYAVAFLYRATAPAYLAVMLSWFLGGAAGCWLPPGLSSGWLFLAAALSHWLNTWLLLNHPSWLPGLVAGFLGGMAGGHWLCCRVRKALANVLWFEMTGMIVGMSLVHSQIYAHGLRIIVVAPALSLALTWWRGDEAP